MSDGGPLTLKEAYTNPALDIPAIGKRIGKWLAALHLATESTDIGAGGNVTAKQIYRYCYTNLGSALERNGFDPSLGATVNNVYGAKLQTDDECVCHGDFWPGNIIVQNIDGSASAPVLTVVDWEMVRRGCGATDIGQFAAEAFLLDRFRGGRGLLSAFLSSYHGRAGSVDLQFGKRIAVHFGTHVAFWGSVNRWGAEEETREIVEVGKEVVERALRKEWEWLGRSVLGNIVPTVD